MVVAGVVLALGAGPLVARAALAADGTTPAGPSWLAHPQGGFSITATEVTAAQFRACVEAAGCEAETANPACNFGTADRDDHPVNCVSYYGAEQYCVFVGGRVCTEDEWLAACRGTDGRAFPYGGAFDGDTCNASSSSVRVEGTATGTAPVGSFGGCEGGLPGLFDMAGNVAEWVDSCKDTYCRFRGAGHHSNDPVERFAGCSGVCSGNDKGLQSGIVGIRCCRDQ